MSDGSSTGRRGGRGCGGQRGGRGGRGRGGRGGHGGRSNAQSAGRWISYEDWQAMPEHEKEKIHNEHSNYAKRKISELTTLDEAPKEDANIRNQGNNVNGANRQRAEPIDARDQMSHGNCSIGQIRSGTRHTNQPVKPDAERPDLDDYDEETIDKLLSAEVLLPRGDHQFVGKVINCKRDADGNPIGRASTNPIIDTRVYEVEFPDGTIAEYAANTIAEALYSKVDADGDRFLLLKEIVDHCKDDTAISQDDYSFTNTNGSRNPARHITTKGWKF